MDIRDILKSFDSLSEAKTTTDKGVTTHKGDYGREFDTDEEGNAVVKKVKSTEPKPKGRRPDPDRPKLGKDDPKNKKVGDLFGRTTGAVPKGKKGTTISGKAQSHPDNKKDDGTGDEEPTSKKSLKEYFDQMDEALSEAGYSTAPMPGAVAVKDASGKVVATAKNPQAAAAFEKGDITIGGDEQGMAEGEMDEAVRAGYATTDWMKTPKKSAFEPATSHIRRPTNQAERDEVAAAVKNNRIGNKNYRINSIGAKSAAYGLDHTGYEDEYSMVRAQQDKGNTPKQWKMIPTAGDGKGLEEMYGPYDDDKVDAINAANPPKAPSGQPNRMTPKPATQVASAPRQANTLDHDAWDKFTGRDKVTEKDVGKPNNATTGFEALVRKLTPKYGEKAAKKIAGSQLKKIGEAEAPPTAFQSSPLTFEGKKGVNPFAKKTEKKKVKEGMEHHLQAARLEGKSHALRKMPYNCTHDNMEEARCYHDGFKEGLDECYGQMPILGRTAVDEMGQGPEVDTMASYGADDLGETHPALRQAKNVLNRQAKENPGRGFGKDNDTAKKSLTLRGLVKHGMVDQNGKFVRFPNDSDGEIDEMDKTSYMKQQAIKTPGDTFKAFGQTMSDKDVLDELAFEALDKQLNAILEGKEVSEGMTVSISKGQQGSPDSVSVSAQDGEADQLLSIIKSAGMGLFGGDEHNGYGAPQGSAGAHGGISVVDDHDGMMALMKKLTGGGDMQGGGDYEDEEGHEGHSEEGHMHGEEEPCNECGYMESKCQCDHGDEQVIDEVESRDQMAYEVAEANAPDSGAAETAADDASEAGEDAALATDDAAQDEEEGEVDSSPTNEAEDETGQLDEISQELAVKTLGLRRAHGMDGWGDYDAHRKADATEKRVEKKFGKDAVAAADKITDKEVYGDRKMKEETVAESFANLYKKLAFLSEESTEKEDEKAEKAGKKVANDIEYDEGHKGKDDNNAEKAGKKVTKDIEYDDKKDEKYKKDKKVDESYANSADDTFEADIDFMTKVISGGLNKQKSTGQTTVPVINGQKSRMGVDGLGSPMKESTDLLKDYMKLSGL